ncbi:MAG TPA: TIGR04283 family arsenosugar biosynthesis glycosyltransferase [Methylococcaceae bacterium]|nr:TIGR04283 family arsenosugar biosynthesis glycosyltransferase [Methylococcaceae bacterium]
MTPRLSIIVPTLNEAAAICATLEALQPMRGRGVEAIVADGGSTDGTPELAAPLADKVVSAPRGRARQMNAGAGAAKGEVLLFLHADTRLPEGADRPVLDALATRDRTWGRFDVHIAGSHWLLRVVAYLMNRRSRWTGIATGDQALFVRRETFEALGGFPDQPLMEDIELSRRLRRLGPPLCLRERVVTSGRRWETRGVWRTIWLMWRLRWLYWRGVAAERLAEEYR